MGGKDYSVFCPCCINGGYCSIHSKKPMEAKDTVMSDGEIEEVSSIARYDKLSFRKVAQAQAKLSFPAGEKQGYERGIREVVKALKMIDKEACDTRDFTRRVCVLLVEYETKLKEGD